MIDDRKIEAKTYCFLGVNVLNDGRMNDEIIHRIGDTRKMVGALESQWKSRHMTRKAKLCVCKGIYS